MIPSLRRTISPLLAVAIALASGACHGAARQPHATPDMAEIAGTYALVRVDGNEIPATVLHEGTALEVRSGSFSFGADGTCRTVTVFVPPSGLESTREVTATYAKDGTKLTMWWNGAGVTTGTIDGRQFTMDNHGMLFVYRR